MISSIPAKCPNCGADLNFPPGQTSVVCEYCDSRVLLSDVMRSGEVGAGAVGAEIEKKKLALELATNDLANLKRRRMMLYAEVSAVQNPQLYGRRKSSGPVMVMILFLMLTMIVCIQFPLFYMLGIYGVYGFTKDGCLITGIVLIIIGVTGAVGTNLAYKNYEATKREQVMRTPEYQRKVWELQQLDGQIQRAETELRMVEQQLKALL